MQGPLTPVTIVLSPPKRTASTRRGATGSRVAKGAPTTIKIGVVVYAGTVLPSPAPVETVFTVPLPTSSSTPYPLTVNVPINSGDTFIVNEYDTNAGNPPNGYLLSTYTSATPIPVYQNATNHVAITTVPVVSSFSFGSPNLKFFENQPAAQSTSVPITLYDSNNNVLTTTVANPPILTESSAGVIPSQGMAVPIATSLPITYPASSAAGYTVSVSIPTPFPNQTVAPVLPSLGVVPDWFFIVGDSGNSIASYDAVNAFAVSASPAPTSTLLLAAQPVKLIGATPGCGTNIASVLIGTASNNASSAVASIATSAGTLVPRSLASSEPFADNRSIALLPNSCTGYVITTDDTQYNGYLVSINMASGASAVVPNALQASGYAKAIALNSTGAYSFTSDNGSGQLVTHPLSGPTPGFGVANPNTPGGGGAIDLAVAGNNVYETVAAGYLVAYASPGVSVSPPPSMVTSGTSPVGLVATPDGTTVFVAFGNQVKVVDTPMGPLPTGYLNAFFLTNTVTSIAVSPDSSKLFVLSGPGGFVNEYLVSDARTVASPKAIGSFAVPTTSISLAVSP